MRLVADPGCHKESLVSVCVAPAVAVLLATASPGLIVLVAVATRTGRWHRIRRDRQPLHDTAGGGAPTVAVEDALLAALCADRMDADDYRDRVTVLARECDPADLARGGG